MNKYCTYFELILCEDHYILKNWCKFIKWAMDLCFNRLRKYLTHIFSYSLLVVFFPQIQFGFNVEMTWKTIHHKHIVIILPETHIHTYEIWSYVRTVSYFSKYINYRYVSQINGIFIMVHVNLKAKKDLSSQHTHFLLYCIKNWVNFELLRIISWVTDINDGLQWFSIVCTTANKLNVNHIICSLSLLFNYLPLVYTFPGRSFILH